MSNYSDIRKVLTASRSGMGDWRYKASRLRSANEAGIWLSTIILLNLGLIVAISTACWGDVRIDLNTIASIESSNNPMAYNRSSGARGLYQITLVCLADYNTMTGHKHTSRDLFDPYINRAVAQWYFNVRLPQLLKHYNQKDTLENRLTAYNAGIVAVIRHQMPEETRNYIKKYKMLLNQKAN